MVPRGGGVSVSRPAVVDWIVSVLLVSLLPVVLVTLLQWLSGCARPPSRPERAACAPEQLAAIESAYVSEVIVFCAGETFDTCKARPALEAKYARLREEWVACR